MKIGYIYQKNGEKYHVTFDDAIDMHVWSLCGIELYWGAMIGRYDNATSVKRQVGPDEEMCGNCKKVIESLKKQIDRLVVQHVDGYTYKEEWHSAAA